MEFFHVTNHGVEGRNLFKDTGDYARFVHDLFEFNDTASAGSFRQRILRHNAEKFGRRTSELREQLVQVHAWVLMRNHYHLILSAVAEGGVSAFLKKLNGGYAKYFNERYARHGALFQGKTRVVPIVSTAHFLYVLHYVHLNPLDYLRGATDWRERDKGTIASVSAALTYLDAYRWSSYLDYCGTRNFPSVLTKDVFRTRGYRNQVRRYLQDREATVFDSKILELS